MISVRRRGTSQYSTIFHCVSDSSVNASTWAVPKSPAGRPTWAVPKSPAGRPTWAVPKSPVGATDLGSTQVPRWVIDSGSTQVGRRSIRLVSDQPRHRRVDLDANFVGPAEALFQMLREHVKTVGPAGLDQPLSRKPLRDRGGILSGKPGDCFELPKARLSLPTDEGECARLIVGEGFPERCLENTLLFREQFLLEQGDLEPLSALVVQDLRRHVPQLLPVPKYIPQTPTGVFTQADSAERGYDSGVAKLLLAGLDQILHRSERISGIPENGPVGIMSYPGLARMIRIVLVNQKVDHGFSIGEVVRRRVVTLQRHGVDTERVLREPHIPVDQSTPSSNQVFIQNRAIYPPSSGIRLSVGKRETLAVDDRAGKQLPKGRSCSRTSVWPHDSAFSYLPARRENPFHQGTQDRTNRYGSDFRAALRRLCDTT